MNEAFLKRLQAEAQLQAQLSQTRILPAQLDVVGSLVGRYAWQVLVVLAGFTAALIEVLSL